MIDDRIYSEYLDLMTKTLQPHLEGVSPKVLRNAVEQATESLRRSETIAVKPLKKPRQISQPIDLSNTGPL